MRLYACPERLPSGIQHLEKDKGVLSVLAWDMLRWHQFDCSAHPSGGRGYTFDPPGTFHIFRGMGDGRNTTLSLLETITREMEV